MSTLKLILSLIILFSSELSLGQIKEFKWGRTTGSFDSTKYSEAELRDTYQICWPGFTGYGISTPDYARNKEDIKKINKRQIKRQIKSDCISAINRIKSLQVVKMDIWENAKLCALNEINSIYNYSMTIVEVYKNPKKYRNKSSCDSCYKYIDMIFVDDSTLLENWLLVLNEQYGHFKNYEETRLQGKYYNHLNSPNKIEIAKFSILNDGFRECTRRRLKIGCADQCFEEFTKLFVTFNIDQIN